MVPERLAHYRILEKLGEGAMGEVYAAWDMRLDRKVALKVLPARCARDPECLERFEREARALATLDHPHITTIHSVEESGGRRFFTMEFVEGTRLDQMIPAEGLDLPTFFQVATQVADAVDAAHGRGVVHRDLKPSNVMVTSEERAMVLDFGLAKLRLAAPIAGAPERTLTDAGALVGTLPYMAPEQLEGRDADHRTDVFALGVTFHEMLTGHRPFDGSTVAELVASILRDDPPAVDMLRPELPRRLGDAVGRCLAKEPAQRWRSAGDLRDELTEISRADVSDRQSPAARSIAVLPFTDLSDGQDQGHLCEGIAEDLIHAMSRIEGLRVASRAASFAVGVRPVNVRRVGRRLRVHCVLTGSVRKDRDRLRVTVELASVADGAMLWSQRFDRRITDVFAIQDEIADHVVDALRVALAPAHRTAARSRPTKVVRAYEFYLEARRFLNRSTQRDSEFALELFRRAIDLDPGFGLAHAGIADGCSFLYANAERSAARLERALEASQRALELAPSLADVHVSRGVALSLAGRDADATAAFERAIAIEPRSFAAHYELARHCFTRGRSAEAIAHFRRASSLRPDDYQAPLLVAQVLEDMGRDEEAAAVRRRGVAIAASRLELGPDDTRALYMGANGLVGLGEVNRGLEWARRARGLSPDDPMLLYNLACIHAMAERPDEAIEILGTALDRGFANLGWLLHDSNLAPLRDDPRFQAFVARLQTA